MNDERFLADSVTSIDDVLDGNIVDVVDPGEYEENSREVVSPQWFIDRGVEVAKDAGDDEGKDQDYVSVDPDVV